MKLSQLNILKFGYTKYTRFTSRMTHIRVTASTPLTQNIVEILPSPKPRLQYDHCSFCGNKYKSDLWPRVCSCCKNTTFRNPIPVAVGILPFKSKDNNYGLLLVRRNIKPFIGELCLPGGFINWGESWQQAISREVEEETFVKTDPDEFNFANIHSTPDGTRVLIFGYTDKIRNYDMLTNFKETNETSELLIGDNLTELCFSLHQSVYNDWFEHYVST